jgi:hypothetical protein
MRANPTGRDGVFTAVEDVDPRDLYLYNRDQFTDEEWARVPDDIKQKIYRGDHDSADRVQALVNVFMAEWQYVAEQRDEFNVTTEQIHPIYNKLEKSVTDEELTRFREQYFARGLAFGNRLRPFGFDNKYTGDAYAIMVRTNASWCFQLERTYEGLMKDLVAKGVPSKFFVKFASAPQEGVVFAETIFHACSKYADENQRAKDHVYEITGHKLDVRNYDTTPGELAKRGVNVPWIAMSPTGERAGPYGMNHVYFQGEGKDHWYKIIPESQRQNVYILMCMDYGIIDPKYQIPEPSISDADVQRRFAQLCPIKKDQREAWFPVEARKIYRYRDKFYVLNCIPSDLWTETASLEHCVGRPYMQYWKLIADQKGFILSIRRPDAEHGDRRPGKPLLTMEVRSSVSQTTKEDTSKITIPQIYGKRNRKPGFAAHETCGSENFRKISRDELDKTFEVLRHLNVEPWRVPSMDSALWAIALMDTLDPPANKETIEWARALREQYAIPTVNKDAFKANPAPVCKACGQGEAVGFCKPADLSPDRASTRQPSARR